MTNERGTVLDLVGIIMVPLVLTMVALTTLGMMRTGLGLSDLFTRGAQVNIVEERFTDAGRGATDIYVFNDKEFIVTSDISTQPAYNVDGRRLAACTVGQFTIARTWQGNEWFYAAMFDGSKTPYYENEVNDGVVTPTSPSCDAERWRHGSESTREPGDSTAPGSTAITALDAGATFEYENAYGRDLHFVDGVEQGPAKSTNTRPAGITDAEWAYPKPATIRFAGTFQNIIGQTDAVFVMHTGMRLVQD